MSELIRCDRCKKEIIKFSKIKELKELKEAYTVRVAIRKGIFEDTISKFDLCDECYKELFNFIESE